MPGGFNSFSVTEVPLLYLEIQVHFMQMSIDYSNAEICPLPPVNFSKYSQLFKCSARPKASCVEMCVPVFTCTGMVVIGQAGN